MLTKFVMEYDVWKDKKNIPIITINEIDYERITPFPYITNIEYRDCIISLCLKVEFAQVDAWLLSSDLVLLRMKASFHSTQKALFLKKNLLFVI